MAANNPQFNSLKQCDASCELLAKEINVPSSFIIEQSRVAIDTVSQFGHGAFAKVVRAKYLGANVRVKRIHAVLSEEERLMLYRFLQECRLACDLKHPNIVQFYGVVMDGRLPMLVMEELVCSLHEYIDKPENLNLDFDDHYVPHFKTSSTSNKASESNKASPNPRQQADEQTINDAKTANGNDSVGAGSRHNSEGSSPKLERRCNIKALQKSFIALEIAQGLAYLHTKKPYPIVHRDLSSSNVLLGVFARRIVAKIADFGQSKEIKAKGDWSSRCPGTLSYLPPEVLPLPDKTGTINQHQRNDVVQPTPSEACSIPISRNRSRQHHVVSNGELSIFHLTQEPGDNRTRNSSQEVAVKKSNPLLKTSIDMYMYGIVCLEIISEQHPPAWRVSSEESWHINHTRKLKTIPKDDLLYGIAAHCIIDTPDMRAKAVNLVQYIAGQIESYSPAPPNKELDADRNDSENTFAILPTAPGDTHSKVGTRISERVARAFKSTPQSEIGVKKIIGGV